ncbi:MAG: hypothetical protein M1830_002269 [Pleopsidium flavum]|nr:MAG: hypothetical protein M1830_002269 [Pleopsidium flavum]
MKGVAEGADVEFDSILAMNVRTEIAYGLFSDGCTALSWKAGDASFLAQNWDWQHEQMENLILIRIRQPSKPLIHMITEAGIIGKIGLNSAGVGVCLNAIRARGVDFKKLPCHLSLRASLESSSRNEAVSTLMKVGVASACHLLIADATGGMGLECSSQDICRLAMGNGMVLHTNHFLVEHAGVQEKMQLKDSPFRLQRIRDLVIAAETEDPVPTAASIGKLLEDEMNYPTAICRAETEDSSVTTLFSIDMDLTKKTARIRLGRPSAPENTLFLCPKDSESLHINGHSSD